jgi:hypothetical protein
MQSLRDGACIVQVPLASIRRRGMAVGRWQMGRHQARFESHFSVLSLGT